MSGVADGAAAPKKPGPPPKKEVKILMIHGFTQNGNLFRAKTRALEKALTKLLAPISLVPQLFYPTGPIRLKPSDMPFYEPPADGAAASDYEPETYAWWRRNEATAQYAGIDKGMATLAGAIREAGGVDGVIGFSQGGCAAGILAGALEGNSRRPLPDPAVDDDTEAWATALREANGGRPLKFCVVYSGFRAADPDVAWLFDPKIATPTLHVLGSLDTAVDESRSQTLIQACENPLVVTHPGGHHVPVAKEWVMPLAGFIKQHVYDKELKSEL
ncbi:hypothetical protein PWT90_08576 [Aphanocladium album]|nr:hypothetical protein PWT90_08576 [Aphanocladium album]